MSSIQLDRWKSIVLTCLGRAALKHTATIRTNIFAVDSGLKPAFLFDCLCIAHPRSLYTLVSSLHTESLLQHKLLVVDVENTLFICNESVLRSRLLKKERDRDQVVIDVSSRLDRPVIVSAEDARSILLNCINAVGMQQVPEAAKPKGFLCEDSSLDKKVSVRAETTLVSSGDSSSLLLHRTSQNCEALRKHVVTMTDFSPLSAVDGVHTAELMQDVNRSTLFGLLLGYPVLYWYESADPSAAHNCLSFVPLVVTKAFLFEFPVGSASIDFAIEGTCNSKAIQLRESCCTKLAAELKYNRPEKLKLDSVIGEENGSNLAAAIRSHRTPLYSFSYPECLEVECRQAVEAWRKDLVLDAARLRCVVRIEFEMETVSLSAVAM